jgi:hypothetical protein
MSVFHYFYPLLLPVFFGLLSAIMQPSLSSLPPLFFFFLSLGSLYFLFWFFSLLSACLKSFSNSLPPLSIFFAPLKYLFWGLLSLVACLWRGLDNPLYWVVFNSAVRLLVSFWAVILLLPAYSSRLGALRMWWCSDRLYFTEGEFIIKKSHTRIELLFFMWSFANRLAFLLLFFCAVAPVYIPYPEFTLFEEPVEDWSCWDVYYRTHNFYWPYFFVLGGCFISYLYDSYRFWWYPKVSVFVAGGLNSLTPSDRASLLRWSSLVFSSVKFFCFCLVFLFFSTWVYFVFYLLFSQLKPWSLTFLGLDFSGVSLFADKTLYYWFDLVSLYSTPVFKCPQKPPSTSFQVFFFSSPL